ncbi:hypothetical protein T4B_7110 [Trichinella pseudospiralis]|uniref:Uncharacterized protein n=2 Tax=Trichinella pseudospiralis TaxID=6337 RepID=A0A0V1ERW0_TRIPS|nr:hypothetical protein T4A_5963 [Trichinella pseudospiralis]KRY91250.1 hypothetical protein T4D_779 [Trichinella pseudospiralis]KRZ27022.1 hypothetical protein T4B_7110 [Trichinella pseudospiralis]
MDVASRDAAVIVTTAVAHCPCLSSSTSSDLVLFWSPRISISDSSFELTPTFLISQNRLNVQSML